MHTVYVGTAGWSLSSAAASHFPLEGSHLQLYAQVLDCVEINSYFQASRACKSSALNRAAPAAVLSKMHQLPECAGAASSPARSARQSGG